MIKAGVNLFPDEDSKKYVSINEKVQCYSYTIVNNNNNIEVLYSARIYQTRNSRRRVYTDFQKDRLLQWWILRSKEHLYKGLQSNTAHTAATTRNTGANPFSFSISALGSFTCITQHMGPTTLRPIQRTKQWLSVLLKDTSVTAGDEVVRLCY